MKLAKNFKIRTESGFSEPINFAADSVFFDNEVSLRDKIGEGAYEGESLSDAIVLAQDKVRLASTLGNIVDSIPDGTDLDTIRELGTYRCRSGASAKTFLNCPENDAFKMEVGYNAAYKDANQIYQLITTYSGNIYRRYCVGDSWRPWIQYLDDSVHLPANKGSFGLNATADLGEKDHLERINNFIIEMNLTANKIGLTNSYFKTPSGLPRKPLHESKNDASIKYNSYITPYDALRLIVAAKHTPAIKKIIGTEEYQYKYPTQTEYKTVKHTTLSNEDWKQWSIDNNFTIEGAKGGSLDRAFGEIGNYGIYNIVMLLTDNSDGKYYGVSVLGLQNTVEDRDLCKKLIPELINMAKQGQRIESENIIASQERDYPVGMAVVELNKYGTFKENLLKVNSLPIAYNGGVQRVAASVTKLLTGIVAVQHIKNQYISINYDDGVGGSYSGYAYNSYLAAPDAFYIMLMASANDLATAFARVSNVEKKLPELSETKKNMITALAEKYDSCNVAKGGDGRFMYYGNTIRNSYVTDRNWIVKNTDGSFTTVSVNGKTYAGQYGLCCNTFAEMVMMGRDPDDFKFAVESSLRVANQPVNHRLESIEGVAAPSDYYLRRPQYSPKITKYKYTVGQEENSKLKDNPNAEHIIMDWGYYPDFKLRQRDGGLAKMASYDGVDYKYNKNGTEYPGSGSKTDFIYDKYGLPKFKAEVTGDLSKDKGYNYYYHYINPNENNAESVKYSYSVSTLYDKAYDNETSLTKWPLAQFFHSFQTQADLAYDLYRKGFAIPFEELDVGDWIFTRPRGYNLENESSTFTNDMYWNNSGHVAFVIGKEINEYTGDVEYRFAECTTENGTHEWPICISVSDGDTKWDKMQGEYLLNSTFLCIRHPAAWGLGNMRDRDEIEWEEGVLVQGSGNYPVIRTFDKTDAVKLSDILGSIKINIKKGYYYLIIIKYNHYVAVGEDETTTIPCEAHIKFLAGDTLENVVLEDLFENQNFDFDNPNGLTIAKPHSQLEYVNYKK